MKAKSSWKKHSRRGVEKEKMKSLNLKSKVDTSLSKINVMCSNKDLYSNKSKDSVASSRFLRPTVLASESLQTKHL